MWWVWPQCVLVGVASVCVVGVASVCVVGVVCASADAACGCAGAVELESVEVKVQISEGYRVGWTGL